MRPSNEICTNITMIMYFYSAQVHLQKVLNRVHMELYRVESMYNATLIPSMMLNISQGKGKSGHQMCKRSLARASSCGGTVFQRQCNGRMVTRPQRTLALRSCAPNAMDPTSSFTDCCSIMLCSSPGSQLNLNLLGPLTWLPRHSSRFPR